MTPDGGDSRKSLGAVRCACGVSVPVPASSVGREQACPGCAATFKVVWALDPKTHEKVLTRLAAQADPSQELALVLFEFGMAERSASPPAPTNSSAPADKSSSPGRTSPARK